MKISRRGWPRAPPSRCPTPTATTWAATHVWAVAAAPGFADAYSSALAGGVPTPGRDPAVITDAMLLGAVQALAAGELEAPPDE